MVEVIFDPNFKRNFKKIKNQAIKDKIKKQIQKIKENPETGKPMRYDKIGTRELYVQPYRLSYRLENNIVYILALYHKDEQ